MRIEVTVRHRTPAGGASGAAAAASDPGAGGVDVAVDVAVVARAPVPFSAVRTALRRASVFESDAVWVGDRALAPDDMIGSGSLRTGAVLSIGRPVTGPPTAGVLFLHQVGGSGAGRAFPLSPGTLVLGRDASSDVVLDDPDVSRRHAVVTVSASAVTVRDARSTNGTFVDGLRLNGAEHTLPPGSVLRVGDSLLTVARVQDTPAVIRRGPDGELRLVRPPRRPVRIQQDDVELPVPPNRTRPRGMQWFAALAPAAAGGALAWLTHSAQFLLFAALSPVMMIGTAVGDRWHWRRSGRRETADFAARKRHAAARVETAIARETEARRRTHPDPAACHKHACLPASVLWERRPGDADHLTVRLGLADLPATTRTRTGAQTASAGVLRSVPAVVDLREGMLGIAGPAERIDAAARWIVSQLAAYHSPADLQLVLLLDEAAADRWHWARWLPHVTAVATGVDESAALVETLTARADQRSRDRSGRAAGTAGPWTVLVADRAASLADVPGLRALLADGAAAGVSAVVLDTAESALPAPAAAVARVCGATGSSATLQARTGRTEGVLLDQVTTAWADELARSLAPLSDAGGDDQAAIPHRCSLLTTLDLPADPDHVTARWALSNGGADTVIGRSADGPVRIDLVGDGPHALIAGTTGSGKSEFLQTFVAGLAATHPPSAINFLLIDYKGGAAFGACASLPHTVGLVTDLDGYLTTRALRSLSCELRRREQLFATAGVSDLSTFRAARPLEPLARLVIVVDEFAALAEELPDFVSGLVAVAQRGRSLGVHLVLATQRPGAAVSPEIRANTSLRVALRVTDAAESVDVVDVPDAAFIERSTPGRAVMRAGSTLTVVQTAHAGARTTPGDDVVVEMLPSWRRPAGTAHEEACPTDLEVLVDAIRRAHEAHGAPPARTPWLPPLPRDLPLQELDPELAMPTKPASVTYAVADVPDEQRRAPVTLDLARPTSLLIAGASQSGRSGALATIALTLCHQLSPVQVELYVIDPAGTLASLVRDLPHCRTALGGEDPALAVVLLNRLQRRLSAASPSPSGDAPVQTLVVIDGWDSVVHALSDADAMECSDALAALLRAGSSADLTVVVTGDRTCLTPRFAAGFEHKLLLRLHDQADYAMAGVRPRDVPREFPPGRGLRPHDATAVQLVHVGSRPGQVGAREYADVVRDRWRSAEYGSPSTGIRLRPLPDVVELPALERPTGRVVLGIGGDDAHPVSVDLFADATRLLVAGPPRSGRSTTLRSLLLQAADAGIPVTVAAGTRSPLGGLAASCGAVIIRPADHPDAVGEAPKGRHLLLVDDCETFADTAVGEALLAWLRTTDAPLSAVVAGRTDDLVTSFRGLGAQVRRSNCGLILRPGPVDGELLGVRLPRRPASGPPGRGILVGDPAWGELFEPGDPVPVQVAAP